MNIIISQQAAEN